MRLKYDVEAIRRRQLERGWTSDELAARAEVSPSTIRRMYRTGSGHPRNILAIAKAVGLSAKSVVVEEEPVGGQL